jgi:hypothetical protein
VLQAAFYVDRAALVVTHMCGKHISAAVNQEEAVFSVGQSEFV